MGENERTTSLVKRGSGDGICVRQLYNWANAITGTRRNTGNPSGDRSLDQPVRTTHWAARISRRDPTLWPLEVLIRLILQGRPYRALTNPGASPQATKDSVVRLYASSWNIEPGVNAHVT
jgi:hypothetical protein